MEDGYDLKAPVAVDDEKGPIDTIAAQNTTAILELDCCSTRAEIFEPKEEEFSWFRSTRRNGSTKRICACLRVIWML